jgi:pimeloyl-ACP methyl ester carboxylesterase
MESSAPNRTAASRTGRFHRGRALAVTVLAAGTSADRYTGPWNATTANPILLIGTRFDPTTPLANAQVTERRLGNAVLLTHDGYGHVSQADPSTCVMQALGRYFTSLTTPARGTICPSDRGPFDPGFGQPAASR